MVQVVQSCRQSSPSISGRVRGKRASGARAVRMPSAGPGFVALGSEGAVVNLSFARRRKDVMFVCVEGPSAFRVLIEDGTFCWRLVGVYLTI